MAKVCLFSYPFFFPILLGLGFDFEFMFAHTYVRVVVVFANYPSACGGDALVVDVVAI
jgi:hypothetical protein